VLREAIAIGRAGNLGDGLRHLSRRFYEVSDTLLFERKAEEKLCPIPGNMSFIKLKPGCGGEHWKNVIRIVADWGPTRINDYLKASVCYVAYWDGQPVGAGWRSNKTPLLRRIGYPKTAVYVGGGYVVRSARGQGIRPLMLRCACGDVGDPTALVVAQTVASNTSAQRSLKKAGFEEIGELHVVKACGLILRLRLEKRPESPVSGI
jgi:GNAT superfamily N-acetyltransferase